jgi:hypothetical protein
MSAANTTNTHQYFNLFDYVSKVPEVRIAAQMAASTAWKIDQLIVTNARGIFKNIRQELFQANGGVDSMAELTAALHEKDFAESSFHEQGSTNETACENIRALNSQRDQWHELAKELVSQTWDWQGNARSYEIPDIEAAFNSDKPYRVGQDTQRRMKVNLQRRAKAYDWDAETTTRRFEAKLAKKEDKLVQVKENVDAMTGAAVLMMHFALTSDESSAAERSKEFSALPIELQRVLMDNAQRAAANVAEWAEDDRSLSDRECDDIDDGAFNVERDIKRVFASPKFRTAQRVAEASEANVG